jgi:ABC-type uncharacterized transport system ATPase component
VNSFALFILERKSGKFVWRKKEEDLCLRKKKKKKHAAEREESEKTKKMNNELLRALVRGFRRVVKCACHKIANGEEKKFLHLLVVAAQNIFSLSVCFFLSSL